MTALGSPMSGVDANERAAGIPRRGSVAALTAHPPVWFDETAAGRPCEERPRRGAYQMPAKAAPGNNGGPFPKQAAPH